MHAQSTHTHTRTDHTHNTHIRARGTSRHASHREAYTLHTRTEVEHINVQLADIESTSGLLLTRVHPAARTRRKDGRETNGAQLRTDAVVADQILNV